MIESVLLLLRITTALITNFITKRKLLQHVHLKQPHAQDFSLKNGSGGKSAGHEVALNAVEDMQTVYP